MVSGTCDLFLAILRLGMCDFGSLVESEHGSATFLSALSQTGDSDIFRKDGIPTSLTLSTNSKIETPSMMEDAKYDLDLLPLCNRVG